MMMMMMKFGQVQQPPTSQSTNHYWHMHQGSSGKACTFSRTWAALKLVVLYLAIHYLQ